MNWLSSNWIWLALGVGALALFASGRGGCGMGHRGHGHGRHGDADQRDRPREMTQRSLSTSAVTAGFVESPLQPADHVHGAPSEREAALTTEHARHDSTAGQSAPHRHGCWPYSL